MNTEQLVALFGAAFLALVIRVFNVVVDWLARVLRVEPPSHIPASGEGLETGRPARQEPAGAPPAPPGDPGEPWTDTGP